MDENRLKLGYPISNVNYIIAVNDTITGIPNASVNVNTGLDPKTITSLNAAGLYTKANKELK